MDIRRKFEWFDTLGQMAKAERAAAAKREKANELCCGAM